MDAVVIQPTGSGKSLCYQLPALFDCSRFTVVICPTLSLISSQLQGLLSQGINAASIGSSSGGSNFQSCDLKDARNLPSLLFTTPENFVTKIKRELMTVQDRVKLIVLDEVHKMFDRTTKFRECCDSFKSLKDEFPSTPTMALTVTLSDHQPTLSDHQPTLSDHQLHVLRGFSPGTPVFPSHQKLTFDLI